MFNPKSTLLYTWHHSWTHWTYSLKKLIQTELPLHLSLASGSLFTHLSFPEISQCSALLPVFFCDQKWTVRWRVKYLRGKVQRAIHGVTFNGNMKTDQINMTLMCDSGVILWGEITCWSLLGFNGFIPQTNSNYFHISRVSGTIMSGIIFIILHHLQQYMYSWSYFSLRNNN